MLIRTFILGVMLSLGSVPLFASEPMGDNAMREHCKSVWTQAKAARAEVFPERVKSESASHATRIQILQAAEGCIKGAKTPEEYQACEKNEGATRKAWAEPEKARRAELKAKYAPLIEQAHQCREWAKTQRAQRAANRTRPGEALTE